MYFNAGQTADAVGSVIPEKSPGNSVGSGASQHLSPQQFGKKAGPAEGEAGAGAAEGAAAGGEAAAGGAELAELAPLLLL